jgi:hypothetical protein
MKASKKAQIALLAAVFSAVLAGCSFSVGGATLEGGALAEQVASKLSAAVPDAPPPVIDCGDDKIPVEEGKVIHCDLTDDAETAHYDAAVTITSVEGSNVEFTVQVGSEPK